MAKRTRSNETLHNSSKKVNYNLWNDEGNNERSTKTPSSSSSKHDFNIWKSLTDDCVLKPIKISDLTVGVCMQRPLLFRVSFKSSKRACKNGDMFIFHAMDSDDEIQITVFPQQTTKFFGLIELNHTYELTNFNVKKQSDDYPLFIGESAFLSLLTDSKIQEISNDLVPQLRFNFLTVEEVKSLEVNSKCDCVAVIAKNWGQEIVGQSKLKRELSLTDKSKDCVVVTLWGTAYADFDHSGTSVVIHNGVINQYNGVKTISCAPNTLFWHDPDIEVATDLKSWFKKEIGETM